MRRITAMKVILACTVSLALLAGPITAVGAQDEGRSCPQGWVADQSRCETFVVHDPNGMAVRGIVLLPPGYHDSDRRYPVLYLLHGGTVGPEVHFDLGIEEFTAEPGIDPVILVMPDGGLGLYGDFRDGSQLWEQAHVHELIPYIDATYRTIAGRAHRAIAGYSSGGKGAIEYAARNPDLYAAAGSLSGAVDWTWRSPVAGTFFSAVMLACPYIAEGRCPDDVRSAWGDPVTDAVWWENANPTRLAPNLGGVWVHATAGNGVPCDAYDIQRLVENPATWLEPIVRDMTVNFDEALTRAGIEHRTDLLDCGTHDGWRYLVPQLRDFWPTMFEAFGSAPPASFDHRRVDATFRVWDWTFETDPGRAPEFLDIHGASTDGVTLTGSGTVRVRTAPLFEPGQALEIDGAVEDTVAADDEGRISFQIDLGPSHEHQQYSPQARLLELDEGYFVTRAVIFNLSPHVGTPSGNGQYSPAQGRRNLRPS